MEDQEEEENIDDDDDSDFKPESGDGGFPGDTCKHPKPIRNTHSSGSSTLTSASRRLNLVFDKFVNLTQPKREYNVKIEREILKQMAIAGNCTACWKLKKADRLSMDGSIIGFD